MHKHSLPWIWAMIEQVSQGLLVQPLTGEDEFQGVQNVGLTTTILTCHLKLSRIMLGLNLDGWHWLNNEKQGQKLSIRKKVKVLKCYHSEKVLNWPDFNKKVNFNDI